MNKPSFKITAIILCAVLCLSSVVTVFALTNDKTEEQKKRCGHSNNHRQYR